jgi:hypothetical protein
MQGIRHGPERAFEGASAEMARYLEPLTRHERAGTRLWTVRELGILRQLSSLDGLVRCLTDEHWAVADEAESALFLLAQEHHEAVAVLRSRAQATRGTVVVAVGVVSDPPPGRLRRPAWVSTIEASSRTRWVLRSPAPESPRFDTAMVVLQDTLHLGAGDYGHAELYPDDWNRWQRLGIGEQIELHSSPYGIVAIGTALSMRRPPD